MVQAGFDAGFAGGHLDVGVKTAMERSSSHAEVHVHVFQAGSIDRTDQTMADIMQKAAGFPPSVAGDKAVAFAVSLVDYSALELPSDNFNFIQIQNRRDVLAELAKKRFEFLSQRNSISYARRHPEDFIGVDDIKLADELSKITAAINTMEAEASACLRDATQCVFTPFDISDFPLPSPKAPAPAGLAGLQETWQTVDSNIDFSNLVITPIDSSTATVLCFFRHGAFFNPPTGEISASATFDGSAKVLSTTAFSFPLLPGQHGPIGGQPTHQLKISNVSGSQITVTDTHHFHTVSDTTITALFTRG